MGSSPFEGVANLPQVDTQPVKFFFDVGFLGRDDQLLLQSLRVHRGRHVRHATA